MPDYKNGKWARQILAQRREDGLWGSFHTLSRPAPGKSVTTEQALRRLYFLGYTAQDEAIQTVLERMEQGITGVRKIDDYYEKTHDWPLFEQLMLAAWVRVFDPSNRCALEVARQWAAVAEKAFAGGEYSREADVRAFEQWRGRKPRSGFETGFGMFYHAALLRGVLTPETESAFLDYCLSRPVGMYYVYDRPLNKTPETFASRESSRYAAAIEVLSEYGLARSKLGFVKSWLLACRDGSGRWDFGAQARDGVYFPLSDRWDRESRMTDSTFRVNRLLERLS